jgi:antirestriction protein ArdC
VNREIYATITNRFIEKLKEGTVPWQKPWLAAQNIISRKPYHGMYALLLGSSDFKSPFWLSFKQALDLGGHVKKGERFRASRTGTTTRMVSPTSWSGSMGRSQTTGFPCPANKECRYEFSEFIR